MPTVVLATTEFAELARDAARALGLPEARIVEVAHPVGGVPDAELRDRGRATVEELLALFGFAAPGQGTE